MVAPDARETIGLQLHLHRQGIPFSFRGLALETRDLFCSAHEILYVMADLMRNHIGLGKVAGCAKSLGHDVEEGEIEIDFVIAGAVEGTDSRRRGSARRLDCAGEEYESRIFISWPKQLFPGSFRVGEDHRGEFPQLVVGRSGRRRLGGRR